MPTGFTRVESGLRKVSPITDDVHDSALFDRTVGDTLPGREVIHERFSTRVVLAALLSNLDFCPLPNDLAGIAAEKEDVMKPIHVIHLIYVIVLSAGLSFAMTAVAANNFDDRDALTTKLTLDELAPLADAEEELAGAEEELATAEVLQDQSQALLDSAEEDLGAAEEELSGAEAEVVVAEGALAAADEALAVADDAEAAAQVELDSAELALEEGIKSGLEGEELAALAEDAVTAAASLEVATDTADDARDNAVAADMDLTEANTASEEAQDDVDDAQVVVDRAEVLNDNADAIVDAKTEARDDAVEVVQLITDEIDGTAEFVDNLDDKTVFALNRSLNNAVRTHLFPLDIDLDLLNRIVDEDFGNGEIQQLTQAVELDARFERLATRFDAKAEATDNEKFESHAARTRARGEERRNAFLDRLGDGDNLEVTPSEMSSVAAEVSAEAVSQAADEAAGSASAEAAEEAVGSAARDAAAEAAEATIGEIARELAKQKGNGGRP
jgi:hypothetical protein